MYKKLVALTVDDSLKLIRGCVKLLKTKIALPIHLY